MTTAEKLVKVLAEKKIFPGDREAVRAAAIEHALGLLLNTAAYSTVDENNARSSK